MEHRLVPLPCPAHSSVNRRAPLPQEQTSPSLAGQSCSRPRGGAGEDSEEETREKTSSEEPRPFVIRLSRIPWKTWIANSYWTKEDGQGWPRRFPLGRPWSGRARAWSLLAREPKSVLCQPWPPVGYQRPAPGTNWRVNHIASRLCAHRFPTGTQAGESCRVFFASARRKRSSRGHAASMKPALNPALSPSTLRLRPRDRDSR